MTGPLEEVIFSPCRNSTAVKESVNLLRFTKLTLDPPSAMIPIKERLQINVEAVQTNLPRKVNGTASHAFGNA